MTDGVGKGSSCLSLTVAEERTHRPGGCVGIFFQLFDWNRRFAKKKLFSKKLLPPAPAKQTFNKFKGGEKMPISKLHLIADENSGGFPNMKKHYNRSNDLDYKHEMRAPSLVARLMGLESMPALRDKPKKVSLSDSCDDGKCINSYIGSGDEFVNLERGSTKLESRPQKLQKTEQVQRKAVTRFGADALQIKSVLSRSRKQHHHHPIPVSPVKSPRIPLSKNVSRTSRLIDAATKILEPAANKSKFAINYPTSIHYPSKNEVIIEETLMKSEELTKQPGYCANATNCLMGKTSWQNCGNLLDVVDVGPNAAEQPSLFPPFTSNFVNVPSEGKGRSNPKTPISSFGHDTDAVFQRNRDQPMSLPTQNKEEMYNRQCNSKPIAERSSMPHVGRAPWQSSTHSYKPQNHERASVMLKHRTQMQYQMPFGRDKIPSRSKLNNLQSRRASSAANACRGTKEFVALNRSLSGGTQPRVPTKVEGSKVDLERKAIDGRDESPTQLRSSVRKRTINVSGQVESRSFVNSTATKHRNTQFDPQSRIGLGPDAQSIKHSCLRSRLAYQREDNRAKSKSTDVISFTFNSPIRHKTAILMEVEEKTTGSYIKKFSQKPSALKGDSIGALLEQKLKELTTQEDDELATGGPPKRSSAMILQELISALTSEHPDIASPSIAETKCGRSARISHNGDHLSPGSVLEASFSFSSLDNSSAHRLHANYMDSSGDHLRSLQSDADLLDSATSWDKERSGSKRVKALVSYISKLLHSMKIAGGRLSESKLAYAKEAILNAELSFGDVSANNEDGMESLFITPVLLELETSENSIWINMNVFTGPVAMKAGYQFNEFVFDCLIECIDSRYSKYYNSGFRTWRRRPLCMTSDMIIQEVEEDINKWGNFAGMITDEIVESEMSHSLGKWTDFDIEVFETGAEIDDDILHILVEEIVTDLWECRQGSVLHFVQI